MTATEAQAAGMGLAVIIAYVGLILYVLCRSAKTKAAPNDKDEENHL